MLVTPDMIKRHHEVTSSGNRERKIATPAIRALDITVDFFNCDESLSTSDEAFVKSDAVIAVYNTLEKNGLAEGYEQLAEELLAQFKSFETDFKPEDADNKMRAAQIIVEEILRNKDISAQQAA